jgi:Mg-chelatase subunit ChlD
MKTQLTALTLCVATALGVALFPAAGTPLTGHPPPTQVVPPPLALPVGNERPRIEAVFVLDTTGSMSGLIAAAKEKIWSIASTMAAAQPAPEIRLGLVAYRDRGDSYVTRTVDLSADLDSLYATLMEFRADGGGDGPESVNQALHDAVHGLSWSQDGQAYRAIFLVGDAPPHMDYQDDVKYPETIAAARARGIVVNTIQAGGNPSTARAWQQIAELGSGDFARVDQAGSAVALATPYDRELARLSAELDATRLYYGSAAEQAEHRKKVDAATKLHASASDESRARRATFNTSASGKANLLGEGELVEEVVSGRVDLDALEPELLPAPLQAMAPAERKAEVAKQAAQRNELQQRIGELADRRTAYLRDQVEAGGGAEASLDDQLYRTIREQAEASGLRYEAAAPAY